VPAALAFAGAPRALPAVVPAAPARLAGEALRGTGWARRLLPLALMVGVGLAALAAGELPRPAPGDPAVKGTRPADREPLPGTPVARTDRFGDPLPPGTLFRVGTTRLQYDGALSATAGSPDGKLLAAVSSDGPLSLWDTATGKEVHRL